jgi:ribosomal protein S18 acetylase RimI-like enzyme
MIEFTVREAQYEEADFVADMLRQTIIEMEQYGGRQATTDESSWQKVTADIENELKGGQSSFLIAETPDADRIGMAASAIINLAGAFAAKRIIHLRFVYVQPPYRGLGAGSKLIAAALDWGRRAGGDCCDLNVLAQNPARTLYTKLGFSEVAINMIKSLRD